MATPLTTLSEAAIQPFLTEDGVLVFTLTSNGYKFMTLNLLRHLQRIRVPWTLCVLCADAPSYTFFRQEGFKALKVESLLSDVSPHVVPFGTRQFQRLNRKKLDCLASLSRFSSLKVGIYMDGDIVVYKDFVPDLLKRLGVGGGGGGAGADGADASTPGLLFQCDEQTRVDCSQTPTTPCSFMCSGLIAWRGGSISPELFSLSAPGALAAWNECPEDQVFLNARLRDQPELGGGLANFGTLPRNLYPNGAFTSRFKKDSDDKTTAFLLHYNYIVGDQKRKVMIANGDWILPY